MTEAELHESPNRRIVLLAGQSFALGLTMAWILVPATAIFLASYGSELLPFTYIGAAAAGVVSSVALSAALRRHSLASVATTVLAGLSVTLLASWTVLAIFDAEWVSFALLVLVPIVVPVGFVFVVGQAGMLLDVRNLKALYGRVVAGFALGFVTGGLAAPPLLRLVGRTEGLLAAAAAAAAMFLALVAVTRRTYPMELSIVDHSEIDATRPTLRGVSRHRFVMLIVAFQMLSAVESQWLDFLVFDLGAERYADSSELARFISRFSVIAYGTDIVFLLVLAGWLLRRFGLRYGLTANAAGVLTLIGAIVVAASLSGSGTTIVFVLIVAAWVTDLTFSDGTSRTSLSAAYQAIPTRLRSVAQSMVEGLAVPVAIGLSGVGLLVVQSASGTDGLVLPVLIGLVVAAWIVVATLLYREYRLNLLMNLRGRTLDPADLTFESESSLIAIDRLVGSDDERDVRLGLDILTIAQHPELPARLQRLVVDERVNVRTDALERLVQLAPDMAAAAARDGLDDPSADLRAASIRVLGAARSPSDLPRIATHADDEASEVRVAVAFALSRIGDDAVRSEIATEIARLARSASPADRAIAALMLRECEPGSGVNRSTLRTLLADGDHDVVNAALTALRVPEDSDLVSEIAAHLDNRWTAGAAVEALVRSGDAALLVVDEGLRGNDLGRHAQRLLARVGRGIGGPAAATVLRRHVEHPDREVGLAVMRAIGALDPSGSGAHADASAPNDRELDPDESAIVRKDTEHSVHVLRALTAFDDEPSATLLCAALRDELDLARQRILAALSIRHATEGLNRAVFQLAQRDPRARALALEWLDVTLTGTDRAVIPLLEPGRSDRDRVNALKRWFPLPPVTPAELLLNLVQDRDRKWRRPWITACALYTASRMDDVDLRVIMAAAADAPPASGVADDAGIVHETMTGIRARHRELA